MGAARFAFVVASLCIAFGSVAEAKQPVSLNPEPVPQQQSADNQLAQLRQQIARLTSGPTSALLAQSSATTQATSSANAVATNSAANQLNGAGVDQTRVFEQAIQQPPQFPPPGLEIAPTVPNLGLLDAGEQEQENCVPHCSSSEAQIAAQQNQPPPADASNRPPTKLELARSAIKDDIVAKSRQVAAEAAWVAQVEAITEQYKQKALRVKSNILALRKEVGELYTKKKQIENLMLQKALTQKLKEASGDLHTLQDALDHVASKQREFLDTKSNIETTITSLAGQLQTLKGTTTGEAAQIGAADQEQRVASDIEQELRPTTDASSV